MKRTLAMVTAILMASASAPAFAEDATNNSSSGAQLGIGADTGFNADAGIGVDSTVDSTLGLDSDTTASTGGSVSFSSVLSAIEADATSTAELETMTDVSNVEIIRISELEDSDTAALDAALEENDAQVTDLRSAIEANSALTSRLEEESVDVSSVVATDMKTDGSLTIYVR